jgi:hypothetical protein
VCIIPRVSPWASIRCPVGALRRSCQPPCVARSWRQRDLGCSAPWRRTPHPLARSAKAHPSQSLLSARRPWSRGARARDAPFEGLSYRAMRRSFRTHRFGVYYTQGFTLGWCCPVGALRRSCQPPCVTRSWRQRNLGCTATIVFPGGRIFVLKQASGTLAVARLGGVHHTHSRAARKPILPRAY